MFCFAVLNRYPVCWYLCKFVCNKYIRERVPAPKDDATENNELENPRPVVESPPAEGSENELPQNGVNKSNYSARSLLKSASISGSKCIGVQSRREPEVPSLMCLP